MNALRLRVEGAVTSFRYPFFVQGAQPTYDAPPPATLYGHIASALGVLPAPGAFRVAFHFTFAARFTDYEHTHLFGREAKLSPFRRDLLFRPRLTLYIDQPDWLDAFRRPRYVVTLGRSQDLMQYREARVVTLRRAQVAYLESTLVPLSDAAALERMTALNLPRYIDAQRVAAWGQYGRVYVPQRYAPEGGAWVDEDAPRWRDLPRAVVWLGFDS